MADIFKIYPQSFFIYLERDLIDSAVSLRKGRLKNYNDVNEWYGQVPNQEVYLKLKDLPYYEQIYYEQIGGQFKYLIEMFEEELSKINGKNILRLNYNYFCNNSNEVMELIRSE